MVVAATSDQPPLVRMRGAYLAITVAEYFREQGKDVLLMMDSLTRFAMACREVGIAAGEPPTQRAYTPSTFAQLARIVERAGNVRNQGSITGLYTVLVEGDDLTEPVTDAVRSVVDGHVVLSRELAAQNQHPAVDVLSSISRLMPMVTDEQHQGWARRFRETVALYRRVEDLINIGAYVRGRRPTAPADRRKPTVRSSTSIAFADPASLSTAAFDRTAQPPALSARALVIVSMLDRTMPA